MSRLADALQIVSGSNNTTDRIESAIDQETARPQDAAQEPLKRVLPASRIFPAVLPEYSGEWAPGPERDGMMAGGPQMLPLPTEQYRRLAAVLHHGQVQKGLHCLVVSSAIGGEGK